MTRLRSSFLCVFLLAAAAPPLPAQWDDDDELWNDVQIWTGRRPLIDLSYGTLRQTVPGLVQEAGRRGSLELRLGSSRTDPLDDASSVLEVRRSALGVAMITTDLASPPEPPVLAATSWRVSAWRAHGYGYALDEEGASALFLTTGGSLAWTRLAVDDPILTGPDRDLLGLWDGAFRFGTTVDAGIGVQLSPLVTVHGGFERSLVFRRHLFGKWLGSAALEGIAGWGLDRFIRRIERATPEAVPVVHFILRTALSTGFSQLRRKSMNWPFSSEAPLVDEGFRAGVTFVF